MTLNEARDAIVAADPQKRTVAVKAESWFWNHYTPGRNETEFHALVIYNKSQADLSHIHAFHAATLEGALAQALAFVSPARGDNPAEAVAEGEGGKNG